MANPDPPAPAPEQEPIAEAPSDVELLERTAAAAQRLREAVASAVVGQDAVVDLMLITLAARGHALLVGVPGLAKTLLVASLSRALDLSFGRVQFTPDLLPADITGTDVLHEREGQKSLRFQPGPIFHNLILADEINRTPPKTQAALLEAMQERKVTVGTATHPLPDPFQVFATRNPIEQEGTYPPPGRPRRAPARRCGSTCVMAQARAAARRSCSRPRRAPPCTARPRRTWT